MKIVKYTAYISTHQNQRNNVTSFSLLKGSDGYRSINNVRVGKVILGHNKVNMYLIYLFCGPYNIEKQAINFVLLKNI